MRKEPFITPRFVGGRFEGHSLPLAAGKDLAAYEELLIELAKHLYKAKRQGRVRVPKGFAAGFSLGIERIDDGSTLPAIVALMVGCELLATVPTEIAEAKILINQVIATEPGQQFPTAFPKELYSFFNRIGRSLENEERIEWDPSSPSNKAVLTPAKRKRLALAHRETYEADVLFVGRVEELDAKRQTGTLRGTNNQELPFWFTGPFFGDLKEALGSPTLFIRIKGAGVFDVNDRLSELTEIDQLDLLPHHMLVSKIERLSILKEGWHEGHGAKLRDENLNTLVNKITEAFPDELEHPSVAPTEEGNIVFEWMRPQSRIQLEINFQQSTLELYATSLEPASFTEEKFSFDDWENAYRRVREFLAV